jgi:hypothetical protein
MFPAASPVVTVEPEEGNFAKPVKVTMPCPSSETGSKPATKLRLIAGTTGELTNMDAFLLVGRACSQL